MGSKRNALEVGCCYFGLIWAFWADWMIGFRTGSHTSKWLNAERVLLVPEPSHKPRGTCWGEELLLLRQ